jgi:hypothetical protein
MRHLRAFRRATRRLGLDVVGASIVDRPEPSSRDDGFPLCQVCGVGLLLDELRRGRRVCSLCLQHRAAKRKNRRAAPLDEAA